MTPDKEAIHKARIIWESRNPQHETNADTGEDVFWKTMTMCMDEYASLSTQALQDLKDKCEADHCSIESGIDENSDLKEWRDRLIDEKNALIDENEKLKERIWEHEKEYQRLTLENEKLKKENEELKAWKESAMLVMSPVQEIGQAIGVKLGESILEKVVPAIEAKDREIVRLKGLIWKAWQQSEDNVCIEHGMYDKDEFEDENERPTYQHFRDFKLKNNL